MQTRSDDPKHTPLGTRLLHTSKQLLTLLLDPKARSGLTHRLEDRAMQVMLELTRVTNDGGFHAQRSRSQAASADSTQQKAIEAPKTPEA